MALEITRSDLRRSLGWMFLFAIALYCGQYYINCAHEISTPGFNAINTFEYARVVSYTQWLIPFFAAMPFAISFCEDKNNGFMNFQIIRTGSRKYALSKVITTCLSGGLVCGIGTILFFSSLSILGSLEPDSINILPKIYMWEMLQHSIWGYVVGAAWLQFLSGAWWAMSALTFSVFVPNAYLTMAFPVFLHRILWVLARAVNIPAWGNLLLLDRGTIGHGYWETLGIGTGIFGLIILLCMILFLCGFKRRTEHE